MTEPNTIPIDGTWGGSFSHRYLLARQKHNNIISLDKYGIEKIALQLQASNLALNSAFTVLLFSVIFISIILPMYILERYFIWQQIHAEEIKLTLFNLRILYTDMHFLPVALILSFCCLIWLIYVFPSLYRNIAVLGPVGVFVDPSPRTDPIDSRLSWESQQSGISGRHPSILWFSGIIGYGLMLEILVVLSSALPKSSMYEAVAMATFVPVWISASVLWMVLFGRIAFLFFWPTVRRTARGSEVQRLAWSMLGILLDLDTIEHLQLLTTRQRKQLLMRFAEVSQNLSSLHDYLPDSAGEYARDQMQLASRRFLRLASLIYFPKKQTLSDLKDEMIRYINIVLSGHLGELPRKEVLVEEGLNPPDRELRGWRKAGVHAGLATYLMLPVLTFGTVVVYFRLESHFTGPIQVVLGILYLVWVFVGLNFSRHFAQTLELVTGALRHVYGKAPPESYGRNSTNIK
jgi:hypothetical protein